MHAPAPSNASFFADGDTSSETSYIDVTAVPAEVRVELEIAALVAGAKARHAAARARRRR